MGEALSEECVKTLAIIGTDEAAQAVTEGWLAADWDYRLFASDALEKIHSDTSVRKCLELLPQDPDRDIRTKLADSLLAQLDPAAIDLGKGKRMVVRGGKLDSKYNITVPEDLMEAMRGR